MESDGDMRDIKGRVSHNIWWENSSDLKMVKKNKQKSSFLGLEIWHFFFFLSFFFFLGGGLNDVHR